MGDFDSEARDALLLHLKAMQVFQEAQIAALTNLFLQFAASRSSDNAPKLSKVLHEMSVHGAQARLGNLADINPDLASELRKILDAYIGQADEKDDESEAE